MKKIRIFISVFLCLVYAGFTDASSQSGKVPPFQMLQSGGGLFRAQDLPIGKPIVIVYFSPDCEECQKFVESVLKRMDEFRNASFALVTYLPVEYVTKFISEYHLEKYPNINVGTEGGTFFLRKYYGVGKFPFVAIYSKNGDLVKVYNSDPNIDDMSAQLKKL